MASGNKEVLYHYCGSDTFLSIVESRTIRLSSLSVSNDSQEGQIVRGYVRRWCVREGLSAWQAEKIDDIFDAYFQSLFGVGFCLSKKADLLSQWRGYADDGRGFSIGFSGEYLRLLSKAQGRDSELSMRNVVYYKDGNSVSWLDEVCFAIKACMNRPGFSRHFEALNLAPQWRSVDEQQTVPGRVQD